MRYDIVTLFPDLIMAYVNSGIVGKALRGGLIEVHTHNLREYGLGGYRQVDERPFGGGSGMLLMFEPIANCIAEIKSQYAAAGITKYQVVATSAKGDEYKQSIAKDYEAKIESGELEAMLILCGRYEGFDQRIIDVLVDRELSIGKFVLTGGELAALAVVDSITRMMPGALNKEESFQHDSFYVDDENLQYPQYTRPEVLRFEGEELAVPKILLSGDHAKVAQWRAEMTGKFGEAVNPNPETDKKDGE